MYTVWFSMLPGDSRSGWRSGAMADPRVTNLWDEQQVASQWFSQHIDGEQGYVWDAYYLYGPDARWDSANSAPTSLLSTGGTVRSKLGDLEASLTPLLSQGK